MQQVELTDQRDRMLARRSANSMRRFLEAHPLPAGEPFFLQVESGGRHKTVGIPSRVVDALLSAMEKLGEERTVVFEALKEEISTQEAADLLQVSRPYLIENLLETGEIPFHKVGNRRRIRLSDVLRYRQRRERQRKEALRELVEESQEMEMGYE